MAGGFEDLIKTLVFFSLLWAGGKLVESILIPELVGHILIGSIFGPTLLNFVPEYSAFILLGEIGLILLAVEAGIDVDIATLKRIGFRGIFMGILGSLIPTGIGFGLATYMGLSTKAALTTGACFGPTSMGVAIVVLNNGGVINTAMGQMIVTAAVADDVMALVMLSELRALEDPSPINFAIPIVSAILYTISLGSIAIYVIPYLMKHHIPSIKGEPSRKQEMIILGLVGLLALGLMSALQFSKSSHLLGAFLSGLCFCTIPVVDEVWKKQIKRINKWLLRLFFSSTVGFSVPLTAFSSSRIVLTGLLFFVSITGKLVLGIFATPLSWSSAALVGSAMSTWGEFAFLIAVEGRARNLITEDVYSSIVFAILLSILVSPFLLRNIIKLFARQHVAKIQHIIHEHLNEGRVYYKLYIRVKGNWGFQIALINLLSSLKLECIEFNSCHDVDDMTLYEAYVKDIVLYDKTPETEDADGLYERLNSLRDALKDFLIRIDPTCEPLHLSGQLYIPDFDETLHGFTLLRWLPGSNPDEWALNGLDEMKAMRVMHQQGFRVLSVKGPDTI